jgi:hypothetical protein
MAVWLSWEAEASDCVAHTEGRGNCVAQEIATILPRFKSQT